MRIKCQITNRFLAEINIEEYYENLKKIGVDITQPIQIKIPCRGCKMTEVYEVYPTHYRHIGSFLKNDIEKIKKI